MRIAALYDIHGNLPALEAVLAEIAGMGVDRIVVGGDVVPGPFPWECLERLGSLPLPADCIRGNGENDVLTIAGGEIPDRVPAAFHEVVRWSAERLAVSGIARIGGWPVTHTLHPPTGGPILFCHATPTDDNEIFTERTPEGRLLGRFTGLGVGTVVCGHTHMQFDRRVGGVRVVNAGSVGMPFGVPGAYWLLIDDGELQLRRTEYDLQTAARLIAESDYPIPFPLEAPPSAEEMLKVFEARAIGGDNPAGAD